MEAAKEAYVNGFHESHPKVAWAMEGLAKIYASQGKIDLALAEYESAAAIRRSLQAKIPERELFQSELNELERAVGDLKRRSATRKWQTSGAVLNLGRGVTRARSARAASMDAVEVDGAPGRRPTGRLFSFGEGAPAPLSRRPTRRWSFSTAMSARTRGGGVSFDPTATFCEA